MHRYSQELRTAKALSVWLTASDSRWKGGDSTDVKRLTENMKPYDVKKSKAQSDVDSVGGVDPTVSRLWQQKTLTIKERMASSNQGLVDPGQCARRVMSAHKAVVESSNASVELASLYE